MAQWKDIDIWLRQKRDGDILEMTDVAAIINSLRNILLTIPGNRRMLPEFAARIYKILFEPMDELTTAKLQDAVFEAIKRWENRIVLRTVNVIADKDKCQYNINVEFSLRSANSEIYTFSQILTSV